MSNCNELRMHWHCNRSTMSFYVIYSTYSDCRCLICERWIQSEKGTFKKDRRMFGLLDAASTDFSETMDICPNHVIKFKMCPGLSPELKNIKVMTDDLKWEVKGNDLIGRWAENGEHLGRHYNFSMEVYSHIVKKSLVEHKPDVDQSSASLKVTYKTPYTSYLIFQTRSECTCGEFVKHWDSQTTKFVGEDEIRKFGFVRLFKSSNVRTLKLCCDMDIRLRLVKESRLHNIRYSDLRIDVKGWRHGDVFQDKVAEDCAVEIEVLNAETTPPVHSDATGPVGTHEVSDLHLLPKQEMIEVAGQQNNTISSPITPVASGGDDAYTMDVQREPQDMNQSVGGAAVSASSTATIAVTLETSVRTLQEGIELQQFPEEDRVVRSPEFQSSQSCDTIYWASSPPALEPIAASSNTVAFRSAAPLSVRTLEMNFRGISKSCLLFRTMSTCECPTCSGWKALETKSFVQNGEAYGLIVFEMTPEVVVRDICSSHEVYMGLISWDRQDHAAMSDLELEVNGQGQNTHWYDKIGSGSTICTVSISLHDAAIEAWPQTPSAMF